MPSAKINNLCLKAGVCTYKPAEVTAFSPTGIFCRFVIREKIYYRSEQVAVLPVPVGLRTASYLPCSLGKDPYGSSFPLVVLLYKYCLLSCCFVSGHVITEYQIYDNIRLGKYKAELS
jgi:hypothetical protein